MSFLFRSKKKKSKTFLKKQLTGPSFCRLDSWSYIVRSVKCPLLIASIRASWPLLSGATSAIRSTKLFLEVFRDLKKRLAFLSLEKIPKTAGKKNNSYPFRSPRPSSLPTKLEGSNRSISSMCSPVPRKAIGAAVAATAERAPPPFLLRGKRVFFEKSEFFFFVWKV